MSPNKSIAIVDYGLGNLKSVLNAFSKVGAEAFITRDISAISQAKAIVIPGVGSFNTGMRNLNEFGLTPAIKDFVKTGKPLLGICLGMQLLLDEGEEHGNCQGLGLISGKVKKLEVKDSKRWPLPHIRWTTAEPQKEDPICQIHKQPADHFYFVHSYVAYPEKKEDILSISSYGNVDFCSSVSNGNVIGFQFHPERSGPLGLALLKNYKNFALK